MKIGYCQDCKELWGAYARAMTAHVSLLGAEKLAFGGPEWTTVADALTAAAAEQDRVRRAIVLHEAQVHHRACPLTSAIRAEKDEDNAAAQELCSSEI
jgi:hypothetical protein